MISENVSRVEILESISIIEKEKQGFNIDKVTNLLDAINELLRFCLNNLVKDGRIKIGIFDIPKVWKEAKVFVEKILKIWPQDLILKKLDSIPLSIGEELISYLMWCFSNIIKDGKVKVGILDIIPFIRRTIKMIKGITSTFKSKGLFNLSFCNNLL